MRPFSISEQATFLFFLFYFNATFSLGVFRTSFGLLEAPVSEKTVTVSQVMHRWIGPADLDGFLGCNDMQRPSDPGPVVFSQVALKSPPFFFFAMRNCVFTQHVPALVQRGLGNGGGWQRSGVSLNVYAHRRRHGNQLILWQQNVVRDDAVIQIFNEASTFEICWDNLRYIHTFYLISCCLIVEIWDTQTWKKHMVKSVIHDVV